MREQKSATGSGAILRLAMNPTTRLRPALALVWAVSAHAQTNFPMLQGNVDAAGAALLCPTTADSHLPCNNTGTLPLPFRLRNTPNVVAKVPQAIGANRDRHDRRGHREVRRRNWQQHLYLRLRRPGDGRRFRRAR